MTLIGPYVSQTWIQLHLKLTSSTINCPGAHWYPGPGLGEDPSGHHMSSFQENAQMLGVHTGIGYWNTLLTYIVRLHQFIRMDLCVISYFYFDFRVILVLKNALYGLMILVSIDYCHIILFSTNYTMYLSQDQNPMRFKCFLFFLTV